MDLASFGPNSADLEMNGRNNDPIVLCSVPWLYIVNLWEES